MNTKYTPILRWKAGEKNCLENLSADISCQITPFIEVNPIDSLNCTEEVAEKRYSKLVSSFNLYWPDKPFYLYLSEDWYADADSSSQISEIYESFFKSINHPNAIPAFDITDELNISNLAHLANNTGVCLRITGNDFELIKTFLNDYVANSWIDPQNTDLLLDLRFVDEEIYPKKAALAAAISDIPDISNFRNIIIASCSFPKDISTLLSYAVTEFVRREATIHEISLNLQKTYHFNYVYADYGPMNLNDTPFIVGMSPNFKIKYTTADKYLIVKGLSLKKGGLDLPNIVTCCRQLINHPRFSGASFSYGDRVIFDTANSKNTKGGNLTNWVSYSFNHHITLIVSIL